jgi:hypothetical protein
MRLFPKNWGVVVQNHSNGDARGVSYIRVHMDEGSRICGGARAQEHIACRVRSSRSQRGDRWEPFRTWAAAAARACRVRSSRSQRGERWEPSRTWAAAAARAVGTPREGCSPCLRLYNDDDPFIVLTETKFRKTHACACGRNFVRSLP